MCMLCSSDKKEVATARKHHMEVAKDFEIMAEAYRKLSLGILDPHNSQKLKELPIKRLIRELVLEWV